MEIVFLIAGLIIGIGAAWLIFKFKFESVKGISSDKADELNSKINSISIEHGKAVERNRILQENLNEANNNLRAERDKSIELNSELSRITADYKNLEGKLSEHKIEIEQLHQKLNKDFEILANKILEEKSTKFVLQNKENIDSILKPLNEKIKDFQTKVEETYDKESKQRFSLEKEIKNLHELNLQMSKEANNLTNALKGQTKTQGNWGELILETILQKSGLEKGREYVVQESLKSEEGRRLQPDVIIYLPENKCIVIDSKVSLIAYEKYCSSEDENIRLLALRDHINSIKKHIKELSAKNYQNIYQINTLDFVLLFMPIEPAFGLAVQNDVEIFNEAIEKNIVIVSPSTLLATLRTISSIWRQEYQNRNALEIARQSGALYDKFQGLISDLIDVGKKMMGMQSSYDDAMKKLHSGRGNLVNSVEKIKRLGAKTTKSLPQTLIDRADDGSVDEEEKEEDLFSK